MSVYINVAEYKPPMVDQLYRVPHDVERMNVNKDDYRYRTDGSRGDARVVLDENAVPIKKPFPEVYRCQPQHHIILDCAWQKLWRQLNPILSVEKWSTLLGNKLAWTNGTGFPGHRNCLTGADKEKDFPRFDQPRVCGGALLKGVEINDRLKIEGMSMTKPVPSAEWVIDNGWYYYGTSVNPAGEVGMIKRMGTDGENHPVLIPIIMNWQIYLPLDELHKLDMGRPIPGPTEIV
jgi:hypothetical protein